MGIGAAMKLMKDKVALQGIIGFHEIFFRYMVFLKYDRLETSPENRETLDQAFLAAGETYIEVLQKVGMLPQKPPATSSDVEPLEKTG